MNHFVIGDSAAGGLKHAFRGRGHQIINLPLDFSVGPIMAIHEEEGIQRHVEWLNSSFTYMNDYPEYQGKVYRQSLEKLKGLENGDEVTVWTCNNAAEQIGLRLVCFLAADKGLKLSIVNTAEAMDELMRESDIQIEIRHTGECNGEQLGHFYKRSRNPLPEAATNSLAKEMAHLLAGKSLLRSWEQGEILDADESRDDGYIMNCVRELGAQILNDGFIKATRVVGEVFGHSYHIYSDAWIDYRLRSLIHSGSLVSRGDLRSMRSYEVRTSNIEV